MLNDGRKQTRDHFENNILHFLGTLFLTLALLLPLRLLRLLFHWLLFRLQLFLQRLCRNIDIFQIDIGSMLKGIDLTDGSLHFIVKFVRTHTLQDAVIVISQDDITLRVQLQNEMVGEGLRTERNDNHTLHSHLTHTYHSFRAQKFSEAHRET